MARYSSSVLLAAAAVVSLLRPASAGFPAFDFYQYTADDFKAYWYILPDGQSLKFMFEHDFGNATDMWLGLGFHEASATGMGPGVFYTGSTTTNSITPRAKTTSGNGFPAPWTDDTLLESGCSTVNGTFHCYIIRSINGSTTAPNVDLGAGDIALMYAFGTGDIDFHNTDYGLSEATNFQTTAAVPNTINAGSTATVAWAPTPTGNLDVFMIGDFGSSTSGPAASWIGFGVGTGTSTMGTGSFYTGQGNTLNITSRYLADVTSTYPPPVDAVNDDLNSALSLGPSCEISGTQLSCMFSRPISVPASNDQVLSLDGEAYVMWAVGDVSGTGGISKHSDMAKTADTYAMWNISSAAVPTATSNNLLYQIHAILMIVAWMWLLPFGIFVSRFRDVVGMGKVGEGVPLWWRIHQPNQYIGCILFLVSLGIIFARVNQSWFDGYLANSTTKGSHQILGILACVLAILQPILATCRNGVNEKDDDRRRRCHDSWHVLHSICGYLAFLCALAAVALGIQEYNSTLDWPLVYRIGYGISVGAIIVFALVGIILAVVRQKQKSITVEGDYLVGEVLKPAQPKAIAVPALAWIFFVMLLAGATLCCVSVAMNPTRTLSEEL